MERNQVFVIAEAGVNHNGSLNLAHRLIDVASDSGADAVKFQTYQAERVISRNAPKAEYQTRTTGNSESQLDMVRNLQLGEKDHRELIAHCAQIGIRFLSSPFDLHSVDLLTQTFGLKTIKIPSGEITNDPLVLRVAQNAEHVIMSSGMATLGEIENALGVLAFGFTSRGDTRPSPASFRQAFVSERGQNELRRRVTVLHCTTEYPAPFDEINLKAMKTIQDAFGLRVGYSDHSTGIHVAIAAAALGATVIEKHFTTDRELPGPDHRASLEPEELKSMVSGIRDIEKALGNGLKLPGQAETKNIRIARKVIVAAVPISRGEVFSEANLTCKRALDGIEPSNIWNLLGRTATQDYAVDESIVR